MDEVLIARVSGVASGLQVSNFRRLFLLTMLVQAVLQRDVDSPRSFAVERVARLQKIHVPWRLGSFSDL